jgi:hypothetical protein
MYDLTEMALNLSFNFNGLRAQPNDQLHIARDEPMERGLLSRAAPLIACAYVTFRGTL